MYRFTVVVPALFAAVLTTFAAPLAPAEDVEPTAEQRKRVAKFFGKQIKSANQSREPDDDIALAKRILATATAKDLAPGLRIALAQAAIDLCAADFSGRSTALDARKLINLSSRSAAARTDEALYAAHRNWLTAARGEQRMEVAHAFIDFTAALAARAESSNRLEAARDYYGEAFKLAIRFRHPDRDILREQYQQAKQHHRIVEQIERDLERVKVNPEDADAHRRLFDAYLVTLDDPKKAAKHAAYETNDAHRRLGLAAAGDWSTLSGKELSDLAEWYRALANRPDANRLRMLRRSVEAYDALLEREDVDGVIKGLASVNRRVVIDQIARIEPSVLEDKDAAEQEATVEADALRKIDESYARFHIRTRTLDDDARIRAIVQKLREDNHERLDVKVTREKHDQYATIQINDGKLTNIDALYGLQVAELDLSGCKRLKDLAIVQHMKVDHLTISDCKGLTSLESIRGADIERLTMTGLSNVSGNLRVLRSLKNLRRHRSIDLRGWSKLESLEGAEALGAVDYIQLEGCVSLRGGFQKIDFSRVRGVTLDHTTSPFDLTRLRLADAGVSLIDCAWLGEDRTKLKVDVVLKLLNLSSNDTLRSVEGLSAIRVRRLNLLMCKNLSVDFQKLPWHTLETVSASNVGSVQNLEMIPRDAVVRSINLVATDFEFTRENYAHFLSLPRLESVRSSHVEISRKLREELRRRRALRD